MNKVKLVGTISCLVLGIIVFLTLSSPVFANNEATASFSVQLIISKISASVINTQSAVISWETNGNATSQVFYDTQAHENVAAYAYSYALEPTPVSQHSFQLGSLSQNTTYHYRVKSVATVGGIEFVAISGDCTFSTAIETIQDNPYGDSPSIVGLEGLQSATFLTVNVDGTVGTSINITNLDGRISLEILAGTLILNAQGHLPSSLSVRLSTSVPSSSQSTILLVYDFGPSGATFSPPITLTMKYDRAILPEWVLENTLYIAYWDGANWQALQSQVDTQTETVSALTSHFTLFAVMGMIPQPTQTPSSTPAAPITTPTEPTPTPVTTPEPTAPETAHELTPISTPVWFENWWLVGVGVVEIIIILGLGFTWRLTKRTHLLGATMRRTLQPASKLVFIAGILNINIAKRLVTTRGKDVQLTQSEYGLLETLMIHAGKVLTHHQLLTTVWGHSYKKESQLLHTTIGNLRRKIELDPTHPIHIITAPGIGYFLKTI